MSNLNHRLRTNAACASRGAVLHSAPRQATLQSSLALGLGLALAGVPALAQTQNASNAGAVSELVVTGQDVDFGAPRSQLGKLTQPLADTPQSVTTVTRAELDDRGVSTLNDALRGVPGISIGAGETSWSGNNIILRGFTTRDDTYRDGLRDFGYYYRDPFNDEAIEVLKGPSSILFGRGSTGGVIEEDSKAPIATQTFFAADAQAGTDQTHRLTADANTPLPDNAGAFRLNAMVHENDVADRNGAHNSRWGFAPSLALNLAPDTQLQLDFFHQYEHDRPDYGIPWLNGKPAPVPRDSFYGFSTDYLDANVNDMTAQLKHEFSDDLQLSSRLRYSDDGRRFRTSEGVVAAGTPAGAPLASIVLTHNDFNVTDSDRMWQDQTDLTAKFGSGPLRHTLVAGFEVGEESSRPNYDFYTGVPTTTLLDPPPQTFSDKAMYDRLNTRTDSHFVGVYAIDTIEIGAHLQVIGGVRWDRFQGKFDSVSQASPTATPTTLIADHVDEMPSYRAAIVYKPIQPLSLYATYGTSFDPSDEGIDSSVAAGHSASLAFTNLAAETSRTYEAGAKWAVTPTVMATAAAFDIDMYNVRVPGPVSGFDILGGNQEVRGLELEAVGRLTDRWQARIGYSYLDNETTKSTPGGPLVGSPLIVTPKDTFDLVTEYRILPKLTVGGDIQMMTDRMGMNTAASFERAPGYAIGGLMARYVVNDRIKVQVNIYNITDAYYYDAPQSFHVIPGAGRSAMLTLSGKF